MHEQLDLPVRADAQAFLRKVSELFDRWTAARAEDRNALSQASQRVYRAWWGKFCLFVLEQDRRLINVDQALIERFLEAGYKGGRFEERTKRRYLQLLREILGFYFHDRGREDNPAAELIQVFQKEHRGAREAKPVFLNQAEEWRVRDALLKPPVAGSWKVLRDWAMLQTVLGAGLKPMEVLGLELKNVRYDGGVKRPILVLTVEGSSSADPREVEVAAWAQSALERWLELRKKERIAGEFVFPATRAGSRLSPSTLYRASARVLEDVGIEKRHAGAHVLRSTFAVKQLASGHSTALVQRRMGLQSPDSVERYRYLADAKIPTV
jgi:site-specific recombinase XerD